MAWGHNSLFLPSGNEGYIHNRDVPYLSVTSSYVDDNIRGLWKTLQPEPRHNTMALQMLRSSHVTDKCYAKVVTFSPHQRKEGSITMLVIVKPLFLSPQRYHVETLIWTDTGLGLYYIWNGSLRQVLPESRDGTTVSRD